MNDSLKVLPGQENVGPENSYETPVVTTFGSVAKLTMGFGGSRRDFILGAHHGNGGGFTRTNGQGGGLHH